MQIYLLVTEKCNLKCSYCIRGNKENIDLDTEQLKDVLHKNDFSSDQVLITGGEPFLHPEIDLIIRMCLDKYRYVAINTNGTLLDSNNIIKHPKLHYQISLDGNKKYHDELRGTGSYDNTINAVKLLDDLNVSYNIASVISTLNSNNIKELIPILYKLNNMKYWKVEPQLPFGCGSLEKCLDVTEWNLLVDDLINNTPFKLKIKRLFDFSVIDKLSTNEKEELKTRKLINCGGAKNKVYVYPDFSVYPCTCLKDFPLGNLRNQMLESILDSREAAIFQNYKVTDNSVCASCEYLDFCNGGCIGCSYNVFGLLGMGDVRCPLIKKKL